MHRGHAGRLVGIALVVVALAAGLVPVAATVGAAATADFTVSLSATPSYGTPPLTVAFQASVTTGTPTSYNWTFGDGSFYNGTNASAADPSHTFAAPGEYNVTIAVFEGGTSAIGSIAVHVVAELLAAQVSASALAGTAPLTVTFVASVSGGTGTYVNFSWSFGDGGSGIGATIRYTFDHPGSYHVLLAVYDSANATTTAGAWVNVSSDSATAPGVGAQILSLAPWIVGAFLLGVVAVYLIGRFRKGSARNGNLSMGGSGALEPPAPGSPSGPATVADETLRISQRVVLHLAQQGRLGSDEVATVGFTQGGMAAALGVPQTSLTNVLRRLAAAGIVVEDVRHVHGRDRRLKVYRLTGRGEELARELRHRPPPRPPEA